MAQEKEVIYRRIRGRIVPIKVNKKRGSIKKRIKRSPKKSKKTNNFAIAGQLAAGSLASLFGGSAFAEFGAEAQRSKDVSKAAWKQGRRIQASPNQFEGQAKAFFRQGARQRVRSSRLLKQRNIVAGSALGLGAFLFAKGFREVGEKVKGERLNLTEEAITDLSGTAAITIGSIEAGKKLRIPRKRAFSLIRKVFTKGK